jgi:CPA2 family monovalent cation:H+ antiporter-2
VTLPTAGAAVGRRLGDEALHAIGVTVVSVRRASGAVTRADDDLLLGAGDTLVLSGLPEPLALAEAKLLRG